MRECHLGARRLLPLRLRIMGLKHSENHHLGHRRRAPGGERAQPGRIYSICAQGQIERISLINSPPSRYPAGHEGILDRWAGRLGREVGAAADPDQLIQVIAESQGSR